MDNNISIVINIVRLILILSSDLLPYYLIYINVSWYELKQIKLLKISMEYYFFLDFLYLFLHYIHMSIKFPKRLFIFLHFAKKRMKIDQGRAELQFVKCCRGQNQKLQKLNFQEAE